MFLSILFHLQTIDRPAQHTPFPTLLMTLVPPIGCLVKCSYRKPRQCSPASIQHPCGNDSLANANSSHVVDICTGTSSPQSLKKILSLSEEASERHRRQPEDAVSNASSQLSSPPTSPQSSPKKGKPVILPHVQRPSPGLISASVCFHHHLVVGHVYYIRIELSLIMY